MAAERVSFSFVPSYGGVLSFLSSDIVAKMSTCILPFHSNSKDPVCPVGVELKVVETAGSRTEEAWYCHHHDNGVPVEIASHDARSQRIPALASGGRKLPPCSY